MIAQFGTSFKLAFPELHHSIFFFNIFNRRFFNVLSVNNECCMCGEKGGGGEGGITLY